MTLCSYLCCLWLFLTAFSSTNVAVAKYFDCRREAACLGGGSCDHSTGRCVCTNGATDYACQLDPTKYQKLMSSACSLNCSPQSTCVRNVALGTEMCYCYEPYYGTTCNQKRVDVHCESTAMVVTLNPISKPEGGIYVSGFKADSACNATSLGGNLYELRLNYDSGCGAGTSGDTLLENSPNSGDVTHQNFIVIQYSSLFESALDNVYTVRCFIAADKTVNVEGVVGNKENGNGDNGNTVTTTQSPTYSGLVFEVIDDKTGKKISGSIPMDRILQLKFSLTDASVYYAFRVVSCIAEASPMPSPPQTMTLVTAGCTVNTKPGSLMIVEGFSSDTTSSPPSASFKVKAFRFSVGKTVNFQCTVDLCKRGETSCRTTTCANGQGIGRKRRSLEDASVRSGSHISVISSMNSDALNRRQIYRGS